VNEEGNFLNFKAETTRISRSPTKLSSRTYYRKHPSMYHLYTFL